VLPSFPPALSGKAREALEEKGVEVRLGARVTGIDEDGVDIAGERLRAGVVLWAAGVKASPAHAWLGAEADRSGRIRVGEDLTVPGLPDVYVIGDTAAVRTGDGGTVPGLAPAAKQAGSYVARAIRRRIAGEDVEPFRYRHLGNLATIGRDAAVADFGAVRIAGRPAWWLWGLVHVAFLLGTRNRAAVLLNWASLYFSYRRSARLITGPVATDDAAPAGA